MEGAEGEDRLKKVMLNTYIEQRNRYTRNTNVQSVYSLNVCEKEEGST